MLGHSSRTAHKNLEQHRSDLALRKLLKRTRVIDLVAYSVLTRIIKHTLSTVVSQVMAYGRLFSYARTLSLIVCIFVLNRYILTSSASSMIASLGHDCEGILTISAEPDTIEVSSASCI